MGETAALFLVVELITGQVVEPLAYGHSSGLSPVSVVVAAIFWAWLWGPVGLILSMPLTLCVVVLGRHVERLEFIEVLLGDRPALTPAEGFYQRILAGDTDEVLDQAETMLKDRPLSAYYDEVAMAGLQMAASDVVRGVLTAEQLQHILSSVSAMVFDLSDHDDEGPRLAPGTTPPTVLCIAGRDPLDEAACAMLAQILAKRGMTSRVATPRSVSRTGIGELDLEGIDIVCLSYLDPTGSLSGLRYLMRRLVGRTQRLPVIVGLWKTDREVVADERMQTVIGVQLATTSLRDAVRMCLDQVTAEAMAD